jgi:hypothetical protein
MQQRANVLRLAADSSSSRAVWLRRLIIELAAPRQLASVSTTEHSQQQQQQQGLAQQGASQQQQQQQQQESHTDLAAAVASLDAGPSAGPAVRLAMAAGRSYLEQHGRQLNSDQVAVLQRVLSMQDYCLVLGMPGEWMCTDSCQSGQSGHAGQTASSYPCLKVGSRSMYAASACQ